MLVLPHEEQVTALFFIVDKARKNAEMLIYTLTDQMFSMHV